LAHKNNVWITCPTTLLAVLTTIQGLARGQVVAQRTHAIFASMQKLSKDIDLLVNRFEAAEKSIDKTKSELSKMQISVQKIQKVKMELDLLSTQTADVSGSLSALHEEVPNASFISEEGIPLNGNHSSTFPQELQW
jgi:DNA anti-recombination protein RmuC